MREALRSISKESLPEHAGLSYNMWAPIETAGKIPVDTRFQWLSSIANYQPSPDYKVAFRRWRSSFQAPGDRVFELQLAGRLLVGLGNSSATDVGLSLHHTWGVPIIPGSAIKGLLAHYVSTTYGPDTDDPPWNQPEREQPYVLWQGLTWRNGRVNRGPGESYRQLFGAPESDGDDEMRHHGINAGSMAGLVIFHDALYVPGSINGNCPLAADVITVHQKTYYDQKVGSWPNDYDSPNPIAFLTVRPDVKMLFALSGPTELVELAEKLLRDALLEWGIGGKTSSGYGRFGPVKGQSVAAGKGAAQAKQAGRGTDTRSRSATSGQDKPTDSRLAVLMEAAGQQGPMPAPSVQSKPSLRAGQKIKVKVTSTDGSQWKGDYQGITITFPNPGHGELGPSKLVEVKLQSEQAGIWKARFVMYK